MLVYGVQFLHRGRGWTMPINPFPTYKKAHRFWFYHVTNNPEMTVRLVSLMENGKEFEVLEYKEGREE